MEQNGGQQVAPGQRPYQCGDDRAYSFHWKCKTTKKV